MSRRITFKVLFLFFLALVPGLASAQQTGATVHGTVADPDSAVIPGATVTLTPSSGKALVGKSQNDGSYTFHNVPAGTYSVTVTMQGFATFVKQGVKVTPGQSLAMDAKMALQAEQQVIDVSAEGAHVSVDSDSNASSTIIKGKDLEALSDDPDELSSELQALAGPASGPSGGQIYVDGFTGGQLPPKSSIREIRINQNPFSAQYDKLGYGRVEVFTKPGTDKFHGSYSIQGNDKAFNTSNPFLGASNTQPDYHTIFMIGSISGPISKSASFTVGGSHRTIDNNNIVNPSGFYAMSPDATEPCQPGVILGCNYYSSFPEAARAFPHPQTRSDISPRIDLALGQKNTLTARYQYYVNGMENSGVGNTNLPTTGYNTESTEHTIQISDTQIVSQKIINETRFEWQRDNATQNPLDATSPTLSVQGIFTAGGSNLGTQSSTANHIEVQNYTSIALQKNFVRIGGRLRTTSESLTSTEGSNGTFTYSFLLDPCTDPNVTTKPSACAPNVTTTCAAANNTISSYQCGIPGNFSITKINQPTVNGRLTDVGIYAEDDWKPKQNLTISYGIRFEAQNFINSNHDFGPRVSFAYGIPRSNGKSPVTVLRGGYGIFYDRFALTDYLTTLQQNGIVQVPSTYINPGSTCAPGQTQNCGSVTPSRLSITRLGPGTRSSYTLQTAIGFDQQLGRIGTLSVNYLNARGVHEFLKRNFLDTAAAGSPLPVGTPIYDFQFQSGAVYRENQLLINARTTLRHMSLFGFYSLNFADANTTGSGFIPTSNSNTRIDYGRATFANRQFGVFGGSIQLPYAFTASPFIIARSGTPYNITSGLDPNGTSVYNARPYFVNGSSGNCAVAADFSGTNPNNNLTPVPINYCTSQANATVNLRLFRTFGFGERTGGAPQSGDNNRGNRNGGGGGRGAGGGGGGGRGPGGMGGGPMGMGGGSSGHRYTLTLGAQASNLFNIVNYASPTSSLTSPRFGQVTTLQTQPFSNNGTAVRTITLQASFNF